MGYVFATILEGVSSVGVTASGEAVTRHFRDGEVNQKAEFFCLTTKKKSKGGVKERLVTAALT